MANAAMTSNEARMLVVLRESEMTMYRLLEVTDRAEIFTKIARDAGYEDPGITDRIAMLRAALVTAGAENPFVI
jgi:DNA-binding winged helix-turn-helix (wHTH) protein